MSQFSQEYFNLSPEMLCSVDLHGHFLEINPAWKKQLGHNKNNLIASSLFDFIHPDDLKLFKNEFNKISQSEGHIIANLEVRFRHQNNSYRWLEWNVSRVAGENVCFCFVKDTTAIKGEKNRYELIIENSNLGTWDWDLETNNVHFNERWLSFLGLGLNDVKHELATWDALAHPEDKFQAYKDIEDHLSGKTPYYRNIHRMKHVDGHWVWILDQGKVVEYREGKPVRFSGTHTDISYIKELELERSILDDRFKMSLAANKFSNWEVDLVDNSLFWDDNMYELFGTSRSEYSSSNEVWGKMVPQEDRLSVKTAFDKAVLGEADFDLTFRIHFGGDEVRYIASKGYVERDSEGRALRVTGFNWDITKKIEQDNLFQTILNNIPIMISLYDKHGDFKWANPCWSELMGWSLASQKEVNQISNRLFLSPEDRQAARKLKNEATGEWKDFTLQTKSGELVHTTWAFVKFSDGQLIGIGQDIREKKKQEALIKEQQARMISSAKLSSLGEMASGIAHEINNPLAIIKGKAYQLTKKIEKGDLDANYLKNEIAKIEHNSLRIVKIIKGLRTFSRHGDSDPFQNVHFKNILDDVLELCQERFKYQGVELKTTGNLGVMIRCQVTQLAQVVLNLLNNAHDAVVLSNEPWVHLDVESDDSKIRITVTDSGKGIDKEIAEKIMQPFFTTKEVGVGTGLGLSISKGIIEMHDGKLFLDQDYPNTRFVIDLPSVNKFSRDVLS